MYAMFAWDLCIMAWMECCWKKAAMTEQSAVPHVLLCYIQTWHLFLQCLSFTVKSGSMIVSAAILLVSHWRALICCNLISISVALSAANLLVCGNGTHLLQSDVFISSSFSCQVSCWQVLISSIGSLSRASAPVSPLLSQLFLFFLIFFLPASLLLSSCRQSGSVMKQDLCRLLCSACLHNCYRLHT